MLKVWNIILALAAAVTFYFAWLAPVGEPTSEERSRLPEPLAADVEEALSLARRVEGIRIIEWNANLMEAREFAVRNEANRWVIPSHHDYPADSGTKVGDTAGKLLSVQPGRVVSEDATEHGQFGVVDPEDAELEAAEAVGKRVILVNNQGEEILDLIVGNRVAEEWGKRYLRHAGSPLVFTAEFNVDLETDFIDWVERDLLKIERDDVLAIRMDYHSVDEVNRRVVPGPDLMFQRADADADWRCADTPEGKVVDADKFKDILRALGSVRISGVRPMDKENDLAMSTYGFFCGVDRTTIYGNEGAEDIRCSDGLVYQLYFGEVAVGEGLTLSAGGEDDRDDDGDGDEAKGDHRYLSVSVVYEPQLDETLAGLTAKDDSEGSEDAGGAEEGPAAGDEPPADADDDVDEELDEELAKKRQERIEKMRERVEELRRRFDRFIFVIEDGVTKRLRPEQEDLFTEPEEEEEEEGDDAGDAGGGPADVE